MIINESPPNVTDLSIEEENDIIQLSKRNPTHFRKIYDFYFDSILSFINKRVQNINVAHDLTQQVFINALTSLKRYKYQGLPFSSFLYRVAVNECNQYFRNQKKVRFISIDTNASDFRDSAGDELNWDEEDFDALSAALKKLSHDQMSLIELRFFEKRSFKEIAYIFEITENLAKVRTYRLLDKIKKMMQYEK